MYKRQGETFAEISKMLMFKNKNKNVCDSISVNVVVNDGSVLVYPFQVSIDPVSYTHLDVYKRQVLQNDGILAEKGGVKT